MPHQVFSQSPAVDLARLVRNATQHFSTDIDVISSTPLRLRVVREAHGVNALFRLELRPTTPEDHQSAKAAEQRGQAAGMASLAQRCQTLCVVHAEEPEDALATWLLVGALASTLLGPVLPPDGSTLYGVRGAMARIDAHVAQKA